MVRASIKLGKKGHVDFFFCHYDPSRLAMAISQNSSTTTNQFNYWPLKLVSRCACLYGINCIEYTCVVRSARDNTIEPNYTLCLTNGEEDD